MRIVEPNIGTISQFVDIAMYEFIQDSIIYLSPSQPLSTPLLR